MKHMSRKFLAALLACLTVGLLAAPSLALSDAEYKKMMKDPAFAAADKKLNEAWAKAKKVLPKDIFEGLKKEQSAWIAKGRDEEAKDTYQSSGYTLSMQEAYTSVTERRAEYLSLTADRYEHAARIEAQKPKLSVTLVNKTDAKVFVALARGAQFQHVDESHDLSKGWWSVEPGETKTIQPWEYSANHQYGYYATSMGGKRVWGASDVYDAIIGKYWIHPTKAFETHPDKPVSGGKQIHFHWLRSDEGKEEWKMDPVVFEEDNTSVWSDEN